MFNLLKKSGVFIALGALVFFTTCNQPMGLGSPIDWEPPVLTMDPGPNPRYVRQATKLTGTVTDNIGVDRVILREASTTKEIFRAQLLPGDRWEIVLDFTPEDNGRKIAAEIVSYDKAGNSGESSMSAVTLIVDIGPPIITDTWIQRSLMKTALLEPYHDLETLETTDPHGERIANVNKYQNGWFHFYARVNEDETRIENVIMKIFDVEDSNDPLLTLERDADSTLYAPHWLIKEEAVLAAGEQRWPGYTARYDNGERFYYRVDIIAYDRSENSSDEIERVEHQDYFCMWIKGDEPKGLLDPVLGTIIVRGTPLPVQFYDDDTLDWAYTDLLTQDQWRAIVSTTASNAEKLDYLKETLLNGGTVYNWIKENYPTEDESKQVVTERLGGKTTDETWIYVPTGNGENDYGEYVLFALVQDKKLDPHNGEGPRITNKTEWRARAYEISIVDDSLPVIVFDTVDTKSDGYANSSGGKETILDAKTGDSPEENTFPRLTEETPGSGGRYFTLNGYTLRENSAGLNGVKYFRMAWIPFNMPGGADSYIKEVQTAMASGDTNLYPEGVQYWHFYNADPKDGVYPNGAPEGEMPLIEGTPEDIGTVNSVPYRKQVFRKQFDILGRSIDQVPDPNNPGSLMDNPTGWENFTYNGTFENEVKLFVFCAIDLMPGKEPVFRTLRLLGNKTPPQLAVYDLLAKENLDGIEPPELNDFDAVSFTFPIGSTDPSDTYYADPGTADNGTIEDDERANYEAALKKYQETAYNIINGVAVDDGDKADPYQLYTRGTILKYWVMAEKSGDLAVDTITMKDITYSPGRDDVGHYVAADRALSYVESLPEVTQRVFLFTATDTLGNLAQIQRTVAVTSTAFLQDITTVAQSGTYGIGQTITLRANFSGQVEIPSPSAKPKLNIRYHDKPTDSWKYDSIESKTGYDTSVLALEFDFVVPEGAEGSLETMYSGDGLDIDGITPMPMGGSPADETNRPIKLGGGKIMDAVKNQDAFVPGYTGQAAWTGVKGSLQASKNIRLDGTRPYITAPLDIVTDKTPHTNGAYTDYFFMADDTISFILYASKPILPSGDGNPRLQFSINGSGTYYADWQGPRAGNGMAFSVIPGANTTSNPSGVPDGEIMDITLATEKGNIIDVVGNGLSVTANAGLTPPAVALALPLNTHIYIDKTRPRAPQTTLTPGGIGTPVIFTGDTTVGNPNQNADANTVRYINETPTLTIAPLQPTTEPHSGTTYYSLDNGLTWTEFAPNLTATTGTTVISNMLYVNNGARDLVTRHVDTAGNIGWETRQKIEINDAFPKLNSILATQPNGWYIRGNTLTFSLGFDDEVRVPTGATVSITLSDRTLTGAMNRVTLNASANNTLTSTLTFTWNLDADYEMPNGLYVSAVSFTALRDRFGNPGKDPIGYGSSPDFTIDFGSSVTCANLNGSGLKVDTVAPAVTQITPYNANRTGNLTTSPQGTSSISADNRTITIKFGEPVQKGTGTITVRPRGAQLNTNFNGTGTTGYAIPPVFENEGYYLGTDGKRYNTQQEATTAGVASTWVAGFYDIYNSSYLDATDRSRLTRGTSMSKLDLKPRTGQSAGPYMRLTHGLKEGTGFSGNYSNTYNTTDFTTGTGMTAADGPNPAGTYMIPDTATKWVLDYNYSITDNTAAVNNIRATLYKARFRWQEFDVTSTAVTGPAGAAIVAGTGTDTIEIKLPEPLLKGLEWELVYPEGAFADMAGNQAPAFPAATGDTANYRFWSNGAQTPVIRVNRRSYDGRAVGTGPNDLSPRPQNGTWANWNGVNNTSVHYYTNPGATNNWDTDGIGVLDTNGWGIADFATVHYRIETETPGAQLYYNTIRGNGVTGDSVQVGNGNYNVDWTDAIGTTTVSFTSTANGTNNDVTANTRYWTFANHGLAVNDQVTVGGTPYYVRNVNGNNFKLSATQGGAVYNPAAGNITVTTALKWSTTADTNRGTWVLPNMVRRTSGDTPNYYTVSESGVQVRRNFQGTHRGFRSYNKDATAGELDALGLTTTITSNSGQRRFSGFANTEASKNYVVAEARVIHNGTTNFATPTYASDKGYEGVFRSVLALRQNAGTLMLVEGSNIKNGMPSIPGFPVRDAEETGDCRFVKMFYQTGNNNQFLWVSTEIVTQWYFLSWGNGGTHQSSGETNNYLTAGYGDLTFGWNVGH